MLAGQGDLLYNSTMSSEAQKILQEALVLSDTDRREIGEALLDSVPRDSSEEIAEAWREEVIKRVGEVQRGDVQTETYSEVKQHIRDALGR